MSEKFIITEAGIREHFSGCTWPELNIALRHLDGLVMERVGEDPARCAGEQKEHDAARERAIRRASA